MAFLVNYNKTSKLFSEINNPPFSEIYDYDLDNVGLTETFRNRIYEMPIYVFLRLLSYTILYNDEVMFDGIYKIFKYKYSSDESIIKNNDTYNLNKIKSLISFMKKVSNKFDDKNVFNLDEIEKSILDDNGV